jgi:hypothetical protein
MIPMARLTLNASVALVALVAVVATAAPSFADVTVKSTVAGKGAGMGGEAVSTTYIKGNKMRTDIVTGDTVRTSLFDMDAQKMYSFDSKGKEADVYDMKQLASDISKNVQLDGMKAAIKPNGKTKTIAGKSASGYDMEVSIPAMMGGKDGMKMTVSLVGPMWIVKGAPGTQEYMAFYKNAVDKGWFFTDPRAAKAQPGQARAMAEMYRQIAATGGIAYETEMNVKMSGEGPMAGIMAKMGNISMITTVTSVETSAIAADLFAVPAGYKLKEQK